MSFQWVFPPSSIIRFITNINNISTLKERYNFHMYRIRRIISKHVYFTDSSSLVLGISWAYRSFVKWWNSNRSSRGGNDRRRRSSNSRGRHTFRGGKVEGRGEVSHGTLSPAGKEQETAIVGTPPWVNVALGQRQESAPGTVPAWGTGGEWKWTRTSRSRINKSCCCLPFHLSSTSRSRPESYEIFPPPSGSR